MRALNRETPISELIEICERSGNLFEASAIYNLSSNETAKTVFKTGDRAAVIFSRQISHEGQGVLGSVYRDITYTGGTEVESYCNNDFFISATSSSTVIIDATISDDGIQTRATVPMFGNGSNQGQGQSLGQMDRPWLIPPNKTNMLTLENYDVSSQDVGAIMHWIEIDTSIPAIELVNGVWTYNGITI